MREGANTMKNKIHCNEGWMIEAVMVRRDKNAKKDTVRESFRCVVYEVGKGRLGGKCWKE